MNRPTTDRPRPLPIRRVWLSAAALSMVATTLGFAQGDERPSAAPPPVQFIATDPGDHVLPGLTKPKHAVTLGATFDTRVQSILVQEGERVSKGQPLIKLDDRTAAAEYALAKGRAAQHARVDRGRAELGRAQRHLERVIDSFNQSAATDADVDKAQTDVALHQAQLDEALEAQEEARLRAEQAAAKLEQFTLRAPFDGVIVRVPVDIGEVVGPGDAIVELMDTDHMTIEIHLPADAAGRLEGGASYAFALGEPLNRVLTARARYIEPRVDPTANTMRVIFDLPPSRIQVPAGVLVEPADEIQANDSVTQAQ